MTTEADRRKRREYMREYMRKWRRDPKNAEYMRRKTREWEGRKRAAGEWGEVRAYRLAWQRKRYEERQALVRAIKQEQGCIDCGYRDDPTRLHFDHRPDETKDRQVSHMLSGKLDRLLAEIEKCDVRCVKCHARRHGKNRTSKQMRSMVEARWSKAR